MAGPSEKVSKAPPYKLLALDGGGIRGLISLEFLAQIQELLQRELKAPDDFVLADYFDYIAGTSTGAIIATCLALGWRVERVRELYLASGVQMFDRAGLLRRFHYKFEDERLAELLQQHFGAETTLGSDRLRTLLMLVMRNASTDSPWPITNNPAAKYSDLSRPTNNLHLPLWQLVRASTAAPTYFPPEVIEIGSRSFVFVDGGVTLYNNPAFQLFLMATVEPYRLCWSAGEDRMLLVSVGTGISADANLNLVPGEMNLLYNASSVPSALMSAASVEQDFLCRIFGRTRCGGVIDVEVGDMMTQANLRGPVHPKLFSYMRYNMDLSRAGLDELGFPALMPTDVQALDSIAHMDDLRAIGAAAAERQLRTEHFDGFLLPTRQ